MKIAIYVTSHGFGHASRMCALTTELMKFGCECFIISDRPAFLFPTENSLCHLIARQTDTGMLQSSWKTPDVDATFTKLKEFWNKKDEIIEVEKEFLSTNGIDFVIVDIPPLPIVAAKELNLPVLAITNFDWYFNYNEVVSNKTDETIKQIIAEIYAIYQKCDKSYILPFSNFKSVESLPNQIKCGNLAKLTKPNKEKICKEFKLDKSKKLVLITFGGITSDITYFASLTANKEYIFLTNSPIGEADNVVLLPRDYNYSLLIASCDVVITKVGYSTLAETCGAGTYLCYASRDNFPEDEPLIAELANYPHSQHFELTDGQLKIELPTGKVTKYHDDRFELQNEEIALAMLTEIITAQKNISAVIDFGTNNSTLLIYSLTKNNYKIIHKDIKITGIGYNLKDNHLAQESIKRAEKELTIQLSLCHALKLNPKILVTNIGRIATNFGEFQALLNEKFSTDWEIVSASYEALLGNKSSHFLTATKGEFYNLDIGGSSTEISLLINTKIVDSISLECGILKYYSLYKDKRLNFEQISELVQLDMENQLNNVEFVKYRTPLMVGIGKVFQNLACIYDGLTNFSQSNEVKFYDLQDFLANLHDLINNRMNYNYHDYDGKILDIKIFYVSLAIVQGLSNILYTDELGVNPYGIELGYVILQKEKSSEI
ncbi:MAG: hypothetical protein WC155_04855 [Candidatus Cloacimonadales bacterium]